MFNDIAQLLQPRVTMATKKSCNLIGAAVYRRQHKSVYCKLPDPLSLVWVWLRETSICACCNYHELVDFGENWFLCTSNSEHGSLVLQIVHFLFSMPVVYRPHPLHVLK